MKVDFKKNIDSYKAKRGQFAVIDVPVMQYLMIDGHNGPASSDFAAAIEALYPVAYTLKFMSKLSLEEDYVVPPLEALWWAKDMDVFTTKFDQCDGAILFSFLLFDLKLIAGAQVPHLAETNRKQFGSSIRSVDANNKNREVSGGGRQVFLGVIDRVHRSNGLDLDRFTEFRVIRIGDFSDFSCSVHLLKFFRNSSKVKEKFSESRAYNTPETTVKSIISRVCRPVVTPNFYVIVGI